MAKMKRYTIKSMYVGTIAFLIILGIVLAIIPGIPGWILVALAIILITPEDRLRENKYYQKFIDNSQTIIKKYHLEPDEPVLPAPPRHEGPAAGQNNQQIQNRETGPDFHKTLAQQINPAAVIPL